MLYVVPTPIGNLGDITLRALEVLKSVDAILSEDTRQTIKLLRHYDIQTSLESFHAFNEHKKLENIISRLASGVSLALVSDAGMPGISDPGYLLVSQAIQHGIELTCLPGPSAAVTALVASGLPSDAFFFNGFLPPKKGRQKRWSFLLECPHTIILYESPHRLKKCLTELNELDNNQRQVVICRELSKKFESFYRGTAAELLSMLETDKDMSKGEFVVVIGPPDKKNSAAI